MSRVFLRACFCVRRGRDVWGGFVFAVDGSAEGLLGATVGSVRALSLEKVRG